MTDFLIKTCILIFVFFVMSQQGKKTILLMSVKAFF